MSAHLTYMWNLRNKYNKEKERDKPQNQTLYYRELMFARGEVAREGVNGQRRLTV